MEDFEREIKVVVVGNGGVGKTSMIKRFCKGVFTDEYKKTIGVDFLEKQLYVPSIGQDVHLYLWDTAGQEEFNSITKTYYRGAGAAVLAFSTTDRASFNALPSWKSKLQEQCIDIPMVLVQNKVDLLDQAVVTNEEAIAMARRLGLKFYRTCVKEDLNVTEVFTYLVELHDKKLNSGSLQQILALPTLESGSAALPASAADSSYAASGSQADITATVLPCNSSEGAKEIGSDSGKGYNNKAAAAILPASVELHPNVRRGKKKLTTKIKSKLSAARFTQCSIQ